MRAKVTFNNAEEFQKLLKKATTLSNQLEETLQQISNFNFEIGNRFIPETPNGKIQNVEPINNVS